jgi:hypothetical protein
MKKPLPYLLLLGGLAALIASVSFSNSPRDQTVFLERVATKIEHAQRIRPETERSVREILGSMRRDPPKADSEFANRQNHAIRRIEAALLRHAATVQQPKPVAESPKDASVMQQEDFPVGATTVRY